MIGVIRSLIKLLESDYYTDRIMIIPDQESIMMDRSNPRNPNIVDSKK